MSRQNGFAFIYQRFSLRHELPLTTPGVQPTNNSAEQAFRFVVIDRHVTQVTRGATGRAFCERIWTLIATCRLQKRSIFQFLSAAVSAWAQGLPAPSLVPANTG